MKKPLANSIIHNAFWLFMLAIAITILAGPKVKFLSEYLVHIMFLFFISGLVFLLFGQKKLLLTSFAIAGMLCVVLKNESNSDLVMPGVNNNFSLRLSHYDLTDLDNPYELITSIQKEGADILSFQELTPDWHLILERALKSDYIYSTTLVRIDPFGKAIYSKLPIVDIDTLNNSSYQDLKVKCSMKGNEFYLYSSYINPPLDEISTKNAQIQLDEISKDIIRINEPALVFGEYNMVYWSDEISNFRTNSKLNNSRKDIIPASFKLPYEHIFYTKTLECTSEGTISNNQNKKIGYKGSYQIIGSTPPISANKKN